MKIRDYWRLAKISLKARKKSTKSTVAGMSISLIIIVPLIFATISIYASVLPQLNENPQLLYAVFDSATPNGIVDFPEGSYLNIQNSDIRLSTHKDISAAFDEVEYDTLHYTFLSKKYDSYGENRQSYYDRIEIDGQKYPLRVQEGDMSYRYYNMGMAVLREDNLDSIKDEKYRLFLDGYDKGFSDNGARQVILSQRYLDMAGLNYNDVYGKKISVYVRESGNLNGIEFKTNKSDSVMHIDRYLFREFEVVGITKWDEEYIDTYENDTVQAVNMIVTEASYYGDDGKVMLAPEFSFEETGIVADYGDVNEGNRQAYDYVYTGTFGYSAYAIASVYDSEDKQISGLLEVNKYMFVPTSKTNAYGELARAMKEIYPVYSDMYPMSLMFDMEGPASSQYSMFATVNTFLTIIMSVLFVFAGIILFAAFVNLFNTIMHSVNQRKNYLGVMRAIGARSSTIPKLYLFEVLRVFLRAFIWIAVIGGAICIGIKILFDYLFQGGFNASGIVISIGWEFIPITLAIILAALIVIGICYAIGCSWRMSRRPITAVLEG